MNIEGAYSDWKTWKNGKALSSQGKKSGNFEQTEKSEENHIKYWKKSESFRHVLFIIFSNI